MTLKDVRGGTTAIYGLCLADGRMLPVQVDEEGHLLTVLAAGTGGLQTDDLTGALSVIDTVHHEVHEGEAFGSGRFVLALGNNASIDIYMVTAATHYCHLSGISRCGGDAEVLFYENTTVSDPGTALPRPNLNRGKSQASTMLVYHTPTITNVGTLLYQDAITGGSGPQAPGGGVRPNAEWVLDVGHTYLIRLFNRSGNNQIASVVLEWYEETSNG